MQHTCARTKSGRVCFETAKRCFGPECKKPRNNVPGFFGSGSRTRTCDPMINSHLLYQLSYAGSVEARAGIEPACKDLQSSA